MGEGVCDVLVFCMIVLAGGISVWYVYVGHVSMFRIVQMDASATACKWQDCDVAGRQKTFISGERGDSPAT